MQSLISHRNGFWLLLVISVAFNAGFGTTFGVRTYRRHCGEVEYRRGKGYGGLHEKLNLTAEQETQMEAAKEKLLGQVDELREKLRIETEALAELVTAPEPDRVAIATQLDEVASLRQRIQRQVVEHFLELQTLLRPDQREGFDEIIRRHIFRHGKHGHGGISGAHGFGRRPCAEAGRASNGEGG